MDRQIGKCEPALRSRSHASFTSWSRSLRPGLSEQIWVLDVGRATGGWGGNWVAPCRFAVWDLYDIRAEARVGNLVVGADELRTATQGGLPHRGAVGPRLHGVRVGAGAHQHV